MPSLRGKTVIVTGATGMIGQHLLEEVVKENPVFVHALSNDNRQYFKHPMVTYHQVDLRYKDECEEYLYNRSSDNAIVFHLAGVKGSPRAAKEQPASFMVPTIQFNTNVLESAEYVEWLLYTSSVGVYGPAEVFVEDECWSQMPSKNDWYAGWAKRMGELQLEAQAVENKKRNFSIVRPVNVYGKYDNFNSETAMVIPSLIAKAAALPRNGVLEVWGNGSPIRDFVNAKDVAQAMIHCVTHEITAPTNIGSGKGISINELVLTLQGIFNDEHNKPFSIKWLTNKPMGDTKRIANTTRLIDSGFQIRMWLKKGLSETVAWYLNNQDKLQERYDAFV